MRLGILSDAHGNAAGLARCLHVLKKLGVNKVLYLGDALGYFPHARATCTLLMQADAICLMGNHEAFFLGYLPLTTAQETVIRYDWCKNIPARWLHKVEARGPSYNFFIGKKHILCVHATPQEPLEGRHMFFSNAIDGIDFVFAGHSHRAAIGQSKEDIRGHKTYYANVGSCGYPRDYGTLLSVAVFDTEYCKTTLWRVPFSFSPSVLRRVHDSVIATTQRISSSFTGKLWMYDE